MALDALSALALVFGGTVLVVGAIRLAQVPFALVYEFTHRPLPPEAEPQAGSIFEQAPLISVVVPAFNEALVIQNCVRSIAASHYPQFEVICVDDGSSDDTFALMQALAAEFEVVQAVRQENAGKGAALNRGLRVARGDVVVLGDAFVVVVIGGMGSIMGSILTGFALGIVEGLTKVFYPEASATVIFVIMVLVLLVKPAGLFGRTA